jgi:hypothetical protein
MKLAVIHFNPPEKYPPLMNLLNFIADKNEISTEVFTTHQNTGANKYNNNLILIHHYGKNSFNFIKRYFTYLIFNFKTLFRLITIRPDSVLVYETLSVLPAYYYLKFFKNKKLMIHYHEYTSPSEIDSGSKYYKFLHHLEKKMFKKALWISHTNQQRLDLFRKDNTSVSFNNLNVLPNYPPLSFFDVESHTISNPVKFVYCGVLSTDNMFLKEFSDYIISKKGDATCDFYVLNCSDQIKAYFASKDKYLRLREEIFYFDLPEVLSKYDIGIVLHKGTLLNYKYNLPNKVLEYLASGLEVWCSNELSTTVRFKISNNLERLRIVDFSNLPQLENVNSRNKLPELFISKYNSQSVYTDFFNQVSKK